MLTVTSEKFIKLTEKSNCETSEIIAEIIVDTADELPVTDGIPGKILHQGSTAYAVKSGGLYMLSGDGKWYDTSGTAEE